MSTKEKLHNVIEEVKKIDFIEDIGEPYKKIQELEEEL